jgi:protein-S-isoprenylcysteine O-methyltransferase Ste14
MKVLRGIGFGINTVLFYLGVPLLGWGLGDMRGFLAAQPRRVYALVILGFALAVGYQAIEAPEGIRGGRGQVGKRLGRQHVVRLAVSFLLLGALLGLPFADRRGMAVLTDMQAVRWAGVALFALGFGLVYWSGVALGKLYSPEVTLQQGHRLVTTGLYRYIRHPRYIGAMLTGFGLALLFRSWMGLAVAAAFIGVIALRIRDEEAFMQQEFGEEWEAYCQHSWRLIPFLY